MYIRIYKHLAPENVIEPGEERQRIVIALYDKDTFIDSFDYKISKNQIRFYGTDKHYDWEKIPEYKHKLWKTQDFQKLLFHDIKIK